MHENNKILVARIIVTFIPAFKFLRRHVCGHIPHQFQKEMSTKSEIVRKSCYFFYYSYTTRLQEPLARHIVLQILLYTFVNVRNYNFSINLIKCYILQCPLGLIFHNENGSSEIVKIIDHIQQTYVPQVKLEDDTIKVFNELILLVAINVMYIIFI